MEVIPAIDIKEGRCVRLVQGKFDEEEVFSEQPVQMAKYWQQQGAKRIHVVDLDGAKKGEPCNLSLVEQMASTVTIPLQLGGGIRNLDIIEKYLDIGVERVILGTVALEQPQVVKKALAEYGQEKIVVGVDAREGRVAVRGWLETSAATVTETINRLKEAGVITFIYTDISRDGMLSGPDLEGLKELLQLEDIDIIASGGISSLEDLQELAKLGIKKAIVGKALYSEKLAHQYVGEIDCI